jgi:putative oxidoreductase
MFFESKLSPWAPRLLSVLRIMAALAFMAHGTNKLFGFPDTGSEGPALLSLLGVAGVLEVVGGIFLVLGLFTRPTAFVMSGFMAVAYFLAHAPHSFFPMLNSGEPSLLFSFIFLYVAAAGAGPWSLDARRKKS